MDEVCQMCIHYNKKKDVCNRTASSIIYEQWCKPEYNIIRCMKSTELMDSKYCMYSKDSYTDEERKSLCDGCEEDCEYNQKKV